MSNKLPSKGLNESIGPDIFVSDVQVDNIIGPEETKYEQRVTIQTLTTFGIAIILHSFIDGLAIGVFDDIGSITVLAISVIIHRIPVACSVGTTFKTNGQLMNGPCTIIVFWLFILASPIGMLLGMLLS